MSTNMQDNEFVFLLEAYKTAIDYFDGYANRVSTRFNILLGVDIALAGLLGNALLSGMNLPSQGAVIISALGLFLSVLLYVQSAQDKYILKQQIRRINRIKSGIEKKIGKTDLPALFSPLDETDLGTRNVIFESITSWRSNWLSLTRVPVVTSMLFIVFWVIMMFVVG
ncbi:MAG: hypothetical protein QXS54_11145 [Candidatus Methanomethylicaceae archaeon]